MHIKLLDKFFYINSEILKKEEICENHNFIFKPNERKIDFLSKIAFLKSVTEDNIEVDKFMENPNNENVFKCSYLELKGLIKNVYFFCLQENFLNRIQNIFSNFDID